LAKIWATPLPSIFNRVHLCAYQMPLNYGTNSFLYCFTQMASNDIGNPSQKPQ
jgi:hypothetical protein